MNDTPCCVERYAGVFLLSCLVRPACRAPFLGHRAPVPASDHARASVHDRPCMVAIDTVTCCRLPAPVQRLPAMPMRLACACTTCTLRPGHSLGRAHCPVLLPAACDAACCRVWRTRLVRQHSAPASEASATARRLAHRAQQCTVRAVWVCRVWCAAVF